MSTPFDQTTPLQGLPSVRFSPDAPADAFGGGPSAEKVSTALTGLAGAVGDIAEQEKRKADQVAFMSADRQMSELETKLQIDSSKMLGKDAGAAPDYVQKQWQDGVSKITDGLTNDQQRMAVERSANTRWESLNRNVQIHVAGQIKAYDQEETDGYITTSRNAAVLNAGDDDRVQTELARQRAAIVDWGKRNGVTDSDVLNAKMQSELSQTHQAVIDARLNADQDDAAKAYFEKAKPEMTAADIVRTTKQIEQSQTIDQANSAWEQVKGMTYADGTPDEAKMEAAVNALPDLSAEKKLKIWDFVKARAGEQLQDRNRQDAATERDFMNAALQARKQGQPLDQALKMVDQYSRDDYDSAVKTDALQKIYAPPSQSDPGTYINLWEKVQNGEARKADIDSAFQQNHINVSDWRGLRELYFKTTADGADPLEKANWERIKALADQKFGGNKVNRENFLYELHAEADGKSPEELWKTANDKLKDDPNTGLWGASGPLHSAQWKTDLQRLDARNLAWGKVYGDLGKQETLAIGAGALAAGKKSWGLGDVDAFAASFGGYDKIKPGTPVYNAIQSLMKRPESEGALVTPANVRAVLERYPDGRY